MADREKRIIVITVLGATAEIVQDTDRSVGRSEGDIKVPEISVIDIKCQNNLFYSEFVVSDVKCVNDPIKVIIRDVFVNRRGGVIRRSLLFQIGPLFGEVHGGFGINHSGSISVVEVESRAIIYPARTTGINFAGRTNEDFLNIPPTKVRIGF